MIRTTMATITIRNVPEETLARIKAIASANGRSMEQELRELFEERYASRAEILRRIRESWKGLPETTAEEVNAWIEAGRRHIDP